MCGVCSGDQVSDMLPFLMLLVDVFSCFLLMHHVIFCCLSCSCSELLVLVHACVGGGRLFALVVKFADRTESFLTDLEYDTYSSI